MEGIECCIELNSREGVGLESADDIVTEIMLRVRRM